jgi:hypothetical protein
MTNCDQRAAAIIPSAPPMMVDNVHTSEQVDVLLEACEPEGLTLARPSFDIATCDAALSTFEESTE